MTGTVKYSETELVRQGYHPVSTTDLIYFDDSETETLIQLDKTLYDYIQSGQIRL